MAKAKSESTLWRAERDAKIWLIQQKHMDEAGDTDFTHGTPAFIEYSEWYQQKSPPRQWDSEVSVDLDRYIDARVPKSDPDQTRIDQPDAQLRLDIDRRVIVREADARQQHWIQYRAQKLESKERITKAIDKEVRHADGMIAQYISESELSVDVWKRRDELKREQSMAAD